MNQTFQKIVGGVLAVTALMGLSACGSKTEDNKADGKTYKVGIVQFVDDASLNQIEAAIEAELDAKATELGVKFDYTLYNGQADGTTLNQIGAELAIYEKFLNAKIPQYCGADSFALNGAFVGYGVDYTKLGTITADMVVQVLVDGKDPATLPVTTFDNGIAMINTESCAALGYDLAAVKQAFDGKCSSVLETTTQQNFN